MPRAKVKPSVYTLGQLVAQFDVIASQLGFNSVEELRQSLFGVQFLTLEQYQLLVSELTTIYEEALAAKGDTTVE